MLGVVLVVLGKPMLAVVPPVTVQDSSSLGSQGAVEVEFEEGDVMVVEE